jgi:ChrB-like protein
MMPMTSDVGREIAGEPPRWLVLTWRLPSGSSTPRVNTWRSLRRLGAAVLTPGAAILPFADDLQEQLDWLAQEIEEHGGDAWVLPVTELSEVEERKVQEQMHADRQAEYEELRAEAHDFLRRAPDHPLPDADYAVRLRTEKELVALQRRFRKIRARDYFRATGRREAALTIDRCLAFRQGISAKLTPVTDDQAV